MPINQPEYGKTYNKGDWRDEAACKDLDTNIFFPPGEGQASQERIELAKRICGACVVRAECLEFALVTNQEVGIWGGMTEHERRRERRARAAVRRKSAS